MKKIGKILPIIIVALLSVLLTIFGLSQCSLKDIELVVYENQDNLLNVPVYDEEHSHTFAFIGPEKADGTVIYELVSAKDQEYKDVDYFSLVSDYETKIAVKAGTPAGMYTLTIRVYCLSENGKQVHKDITYLYTVEKAKSEYTLEPAIIEDLIYNGNMQQLMIAGSTPQGTIMYKLDDGEWSLEIPSAKEAGIYTVSYKLVGDSNHEDISEKSMMVAIRQAAAGYSPGISFKVGGSLSDLISYIRNNTHEDGRIVVESATSAYVEVTYNGEIQYNGYHCPQGVQMTGTDCGIEAGTYVAVYMPLPNYCWPDGSRVPITVTLVIKKKVLPLPEVNDVLQYNGECQYANIENFDEETMCIVGNRGKEVGTYTAVIILKDKDNYRWADGRILDVVLTWHIFPRKVTVPEVTTVFVYKATGILHLPVLQYVKESDFNYFDGNLMKIVSGNSGTFADDYEVRVVLKDKENFEWADEEGGSKDRLIPWQILRKSVGDRPKDVKVTYDGWPHGNDYGIREGLLVEGVTAGVKAGEYKALYTPLENYCWSDGEYEKVEVTLTIEKATTRIVAAPEAYDDLIYNGSLMPLLKQTGISDAGIMMYKTVFEGEEGHYTYLQPYRSEAGTYRIYYYAIGDENHYNSDETYLDVTIAKADPLITSKPQRIEVMYDGQDHDLVTNGESAHGHFEYSIDNVDFSTEIPQGKDAGVYYVYVRFIGDSNHNDLDTYRIVSRILKDDDAQYISRPEGKQMTYTGQPLALVEPGTVDEAVGQIMYSLDQENWSSEVPTAIKVGSYEAFYMIKGSSNYVDSPIESVTSEINNADLQYSVNVKQVYEYKEDTPQGTPVTVTTVDGSEASITYKYNDQYYDKDNYPQFTDVLLNGFNRVTERVIYYEVTAENHNAISGVYTILITKARPELEISGKQLQYTGEPMELVETSLKGGTITYTDKGWPYIEIVPARKDVGEYTVYYKVEGDDNHYDLDGSVKAEIVNADMEVIAEDQSHVYDGSRFGEPINVSTVDGSKARIRYGTGDGQYNLMIAPQISNVNETMIVYYKVTAANHNDVTGSYNLTVSKAEPDYTAPEACQNIIYDGSYKPLVTEGASENGTMLYKVIYKETESAYSPNVPTGIDPGEYQVWYYCAGDQNHLDSQAQSIAVMIFESESQIGQPQNQNNLLGGSFVNNVQSEDILDESNTVPADQNPQPAEPTDSVTDDLDPNSNDITVPEIPEDGNRSETDNPEEDPEKLIIIDKPEKVKIDLSDVRILSQVDGKGENVSYFKSDGDRITMDEDTPEGTYIIEATVKIVWTVDKEGNTKMVILDAETNKEITTPETSDKKSSPPVAEEKKDTEEITITPVEPIEDLPGMPEFIVPETNNNITDDDDEDEDEVVDVQIDGDVYNDQNNSEIVVNDKQADTGSSDNPKTVEEVNSDQPENNDNQE